MLRRLLFLTLLTASLAAQESRHVTLHYAFTVKDIPAGQKIRIWFPAAHTDLWQQVSVVSTTGDLPLKRNRESRFGNEMYYAESAKSEKSELRFEVVYDVVRQQRIVLGRAIPRLGDYKIEEKQRKLFLLPDKFVPTTGVPADLAAKATEGKNTSLEKARAIYDYVLTTLSYDKSANGAGRGDALYAADAKKGDCTDFHSLFIAMARSQGIPARFEIGFALPTDKQIEEISEYGCWADFFDPKNGWVPVDLVAGWQHAEKRDFYFGAHDANRVAFTTGRDLILNPKQDGDPLNYFVYPYVEVNGKTYAAISTAISYSENTTAATSK